MFSAVILRIFVIATTSSRSVTGIAGRDGAGGAPRSPAPRGRTSAGAAACAAAPRDGAGPATLRFSRYDRMSFFVTRLWMPVPSTSPISIACSWAILRTSGEERRRIRSSIDST